LEEGIAMKKIFVLLALLVLACSHHPMKMFSLAGDDPYEQQELAWRKQKRELIDIDDLANNEKYDKALEDVIGFQSKYPGSPYFQASKLIEAKSLRGRGNYNEAIEVCQEIQTVTQGKNEELWALARYESTFSYEQIGDRVKALSILLGFEKEKPMLADEILYAEMPARIAALYAAEGRDKEAREYLAKSDRGLKDLIQKRGMAEHREWLAETLFKMGSVTPQHLEDANFEKVLQAHSKTQEYLIKAMELNVPIWSQRSADELIKDYRNYWNFIQTAYSDVEDKNKRNEGYKSMHALISESLYRQPSEPELWNQSLRTYYSFANSLEEELSNKLFTATETSLTSDKYPGELPTKLPPKKETPKPKAKPQKSIKNTDPNM
jgi:hypothetical protein